MNEELLKYYEYLKAEKADVPDNFESFEGTLRDDISAKKYYDYLATNDFDVPDTFESFQNTFGLKKKPLQDGIGDVLAPVFADPQGGSQPVQTASAEQPIASPGDQGEILVNAPQVQKDFGQMSIEDIDAQLRQEIEAEKQKQSVPGFSLPDEQPQMAFDRPGQQMPPSRAEMDANVFEQKKDHLKGLIAKEDRAKMADELQKYSGVMIDNIDKGIAKVREDAKKKGVFMGGSPNSAIIPNDNEYKQKIEVMNMAKEILENVKDTPDQGGFLDGLASKGVTGVLPFIGGIAEGKTLNKLMKVSTEGQFRQKTDAEETLLTAEQLRKEFEAAKENPDGYRWGRVLAEMIPYIGEYAATSGVYTGARGLATEGLKSILKGAATKPAVLNGVVKPISTLVGISAQTAVNPTRVINTTYERMTPQMKLALDLDKNELKGVMEPLGKPGEGFKEAFAKAFGVNALELLTERFGQWSKEAGDAMKLNGDWLPQIVFGKWMEKRGFIDLAKAKTVAKQIGYDGIIQEIWFEEYPNKLLQNAVTGDQKWSPDFFNPLSQEFIDMIPATLALGGGAVGAGAFGKYMERMDREDQIAKLKKVMEDEATATPTGEDIGTKPGDFTNLEKLVAEQEAKADEKPQPQPAEVKPEPAVVPETPKEEALPKKEEPKEQVDKVQEILDNEDLTTQDIANEIEAIEEHPKYEELQAAVNKYRGEVMTDQEDYGMRGDSEQYEEEFLTEIRRIIGPSESKSKEEEIREANPELSKQSFKDELAVWNYINDKILEKSGFNSPMEMTPAGLKIHSELIKSGVEKFKNGQLKTLKEANDLIDAGMASQEEQQAPEAYVPKDGWETHLIKAREYAVNLGIEPKGKGLSDLVGEIHQKLQSNAVPERSTEKIPVGEAPGGSQEVVKGVPTKEETPVPQVKDAEKEVKRTEKDITWIMDTRLPRESRGETVKVKLIRKDGKEETVSMPANEVIADFKNRVGLKKTAGGKSPMEQLMDCFGKK